MNKRTFQVLNFFAFNFLFFALYINFIHKDNSSEANTPAYQTTAKAAPARSKKNLKVEEAQGTSNNSVAEAQPAFN